MKTRTLKQLLLYNYRFLFAYVVIAVFSLYFLGWRLSEIGPGLSQPELVNAARHIDLHSLLNLPIYPLQSLLQWGSMHLLGISTLSIRLPSVLLAGATALCLYNLLKRWFGKSTALLSTAIFLSADWVLFIARQGVGSIEFSFWLALSLLTFIKLLGHKSYWLIILSLSLFGLCFSPFGPYAVVTLVACLFGFGTFRQRILETPLLIKIVSGFVCFVGLAAIVVLSVINLDFLKNILAIQNLPSISQYFSNVFTNVSSVVLVLPSYNPIASPHGIFFVRFFELIFIIFGVAMLWRTKVNRLNLVVLIVTTVLALISGLSSGSRGSGTILVPAAIYITAGIRHLMHRWKRTFPKNPYARLAAFIPLGVLFFCVIVLHYHSYFTLWPNQTTTHTAYNRDFELVQTELQKTSDAQCLVVTPNQEIRTLLSHSKNGCLVSYAFQVVRPPAPGERIITIPSAVANFSGNYTVRPLVSDSKSSNVRWLVFESP